MCLHQIFIHTFSNFVAESKINLAIRVALLCGEPIPFRCFGGVSRNALAHVMYVSEIELGIWITLLGEFFLPFDIC